MGGHDLGRGCLAKDPAEYSVGFLFDQMGFSVTDSAKGALAMVLACCMWGLQALFYKLLVHVPPFEILAHRTLWSLVLLLLVLMAMGKLGRLRTFLSDSSVVWRLAIASLMIASNWGTFVLAVQLGMVTQSSLGYFIFPLVAVALGAFVLKEQLSLLQWVAIGLATIAIVVLTVGLGQAPWISLFLAITFGIYGLIKKPISIGPITSVTAEVLLIAPIALIWILGTEFAGWQGIRGTSGGYFFGGPDWWLLILSGPLTCAPLVLMSFAIERMKLSTVGLMQYLNPMLQFSLAVLIFAEPVTRWHGVAFPMIWIGLAIYTFESLRQETRGKTAIAASTSSQTDT